MVENLCEAPVTKIILATSVIYRTRIHLRLIFGFLPRFFYGESVSILPRMYGVDCSSPHHSGV